MNSVNVPINKIKRFHKLNLKLLSLFSLFVKHPSCLVVLNKTLIDGIFDKHVSKLTRVVCQIIISQQVCVGRYSYLPCAFNIVFFGYSLILTSNLLFTIDRTMLNNTKDKDTRTRQIRFMPHRCRLTNYR